jgi:hypothetical protein
MVSDGSISMGGLLRYGRAWTHKRLGWKLMLQWHLCVEHEHGKSQGAMVFSGGLSLK